jgi:ribosomal-protein-alanine N-acetyltransferase
MTDFLSYLRQPDVAAHELVGERLLLRPPRLSDFAEWAALRAESREFLQPWEPLWPPDDLTPQAWRRRLRGYWREIREGTALPMLIFDRHTGVLLGGITMSSIRRGNAQTATLGYWIGARHARRGYMTTAVRMLVRHAFSDMGLHRLEAACVPENVPSRRLLEKCGFRREGYARRYLRINGKWRDHLLYALLAEDLPPEQKA